MAVDWSAGVPIMGGRRGALSSGLRSGSVRERRRGVEGCVSVVGARLVGRLINGRKSHI